MSALTIGIDIGGTKTAAGLVDTQDAVIDRIEAPTPAAAGPGPILANAVALARELLGRIPADGTVGYTVDAVGIGSAGAIDSVGRIVLSATDHLHSWAGTAIGSVVESALALPVSVDNDVHAHAVGEVVAGAGRGHRAAIVAAIGTGIGGAIVVDGAPLTGAHGIAGHIGHLPAAAAAGVRCPCGRTGHLEGISSGSGLAKLYLQRGGDAAADTAEKVIAIAPDDALARDCVTVSAAALGQALGGLVNAVDPDVVIIAGGLRNAGPLWWDSVDAALRDSALPVLAATPLVPAQLGDDAAIIGAAHRARHRSGGGGLR